MQNLQQHLNQLMTTLQLEDSPVGGSIVIYHKGKAVAESSIGKANPNINWDKHTLSLNFSTGKGVLATLIHVLVTNDILEYEKPIAHYWSQFGQNGKQDITLKEVLTHQSGLFNIKSITQNSEDLLHWELMLSRVEAMSTEKPHNLQAESAYSALVCGWVLGGLIEKTTGLELNEALTEYLAKPLGIDDQIYFGLPKEKLSQVATLHKNFEDFDQLITPNDSLENSAIFANKDFTNQETSNKRLLNKRFSNKRVSNKNNKPTLHQDNERIIEAYKSLPSYECWRQAFVDNHNAKIKKTDQSNKNDAIANIDLKTLGIAGLYFDMRSIDLNDFKNALMPNGKTTFNYYTAEALMAKIPAANNVASADALAKIYALLANKGKFEDKELISPKVFNALSQVYIRGSDAIMPATKPKSMQWRLGYHRLFSICTDINQTSDGFGHMGYNGSVAWCDPKKELAVAYIHNYDVTMSTDIRQFAITEAILKWFG